jgi:hypothetical protein
MADSVPPIPPLASCLHCRSILIAQGGGCRDLAPAELLELVRLVPVSGLGLLRVDRPYLGDARGVGAPHACPAWEYREPRTHVPAD